LRIGVACGDEYGRKPGRVVGGGLVGDDLVDHGADLADVAGGDTPDRDVRDVVDAGVGSGLVDVPFAIEAVDVGVPGGEVAGTVVDVCEIQVAEVFGLPVVCGAGVTDWEPPAVLELAAAAADEEHVLDAPLVHGGLDEVLDFFSLVSSLGGHGLVDIIEGLEYRGEPHVVFVGDEGLECGDEVLRGEDEQTVGARLQRRLGLGWLGLYADHTGDRAENRKYREENDGFCHGWMVHCQCPFIHGPLLL
jgi:hypothetical protein